MFEPVSPRERTGGRLNPISPAQIARFKEATNSRRRTRGPKSHRGRRGGLTYFTISEVGLHRRFEDAWLVEPDLDLGFDVYNLTGMLLYDALLSSLRN